MAHRNICHVQLVANDKCHIINCGIRRINQSIYINSFQIWFLIVVKQMHIA